VNFIQTYIQAGGIAALLLVLGVVLDGQPTDTETDQAIADDMNVAIAQARRQAHIDRAEAAMNAAFAQAPARHASQAMLVAACHMASRGGC